MHEPEDQQQERNAERHGQQRPLQHVAREEGRRGAIESEALLDHERAPCIERKGEQREHDGQAEDGAQVVKVALAQQRMGGALDGGKSAAHGNRQQRDAVDREGFQQPCALLGERVVGRLVMGLDRDQALEVRRNALAVHRDVAHLAQCQEQSPRDGGERERDEDDG